MCDESFLARALGDGQVRELELVRRLDEAHPVAAQFKQHLLDVHRSQALFGNLKQLVDLYVEPVNVNSVQVQRINEHNPD